MAKRPRISDLANGFHDCYQVEVKILKTQKQLLKDFIRMQVQLEKEAN